MGSSFESPLVAVTLDGLLRALPASVRVLHPGRGGAVVTWVGPSELDDPVPFLVPGEVLLTSGMPFRSPAQDGGEPQIADETAADRYVASLARAEVRALGIGLAPHHDRTPAGVLAACRRHGLGLFEVPPEVSFAAIGLVFAQLMESARARVLRDLHDSTRRLLAASLSERPEHGVVAALARGGVDWAVLLGADGQVRAGSSPASSDQLAPLVERVLGGTGARLEIARFEGLDAPVVEAHPLRAAGGDTVGVLAAGSGQPLAPSAAGTVRAAVTVLEVLQRRRQGRAEAVGELAARMLLRAPEADGAAPDPLILRSAGAADGSRLRVVMGLPRERAGGAVAASFWGHLLDTPLVVPDGEGFTAITRVDPSAGAVAEARRRDWLLAIGDPVDAGRLREAAAQVRAVRDQLRRSDRSLRVGEQPLSVASLLGPRAGAALARELLGPLLEPTPAAAEQRRVLSAWLARGGVWEAAARDLDLHRNTVRRQIEAIEHELGLDLTDMSVRTDLWVALRFADDAAGPPGGARPQPRSHRV
ncbi:PucR family transcriptional regulator [Kocuria palustris]|uniref:PucR family transcriptional regulator n=1 Tax=Kocuria palustris TaxID=71999 RepID=UPI0011A7F48F|nr:PucR family transcriptional regulator [Kocuria palustris]